MLDPPSQQKISGVPEHRLPAMLNETAHKVILRQNVDPGADGFCFEDGLANSGWHSAASAAFGRGSSKENAMTDWMHVFPADEVLGSSSTSAIAAPPGSRSAHHQRTFYEVIPPEYRPPYPRRTCGVSGQVDVNRKKMGYCAYWKFAFSGAVPPLMVSQKLQPMAPQGRAEQGSYAGAGVVGKQQSEVGEDLGSFNIPQKPGAFGRAGVDTVTSKNQGYYDFPQEQAGGSSSSSNGASYQQQHHQQQLGMPTLADMKNGIGAAPPLSTQGVQPPGYANRPLPRLPQQLENIIPEADWRAFVFEVAKFYQDRPVCLPLPKVLFENCLRSWGADPDADEDQERLEFFCNCSDFLCCLSAGILSPFCFIIAHEQKKTSLERQEARFFQQKAFEFQTKYNVILQVCKLDEIENGRPNFQDSCFGSVLTCGMIRRHSFQVRWIQLLTALPVRVERVDTLMLPPNQAQMLASNSCAGGSAGAVSLFGGGTSTGAAVSATASVPWQTLSLVDNQRAETLGSTTVGVPVFNQQQAQAVPSMGAAGSTSSSLPPYTTAATSGVPFHKQ
ncbi:unnamed protein product [Amoebophrya sp. A120]|nr:unnamed protein product [Amoebophrya sp. A120]|eukprot:GSA120T00021845001.1